MKIPTYVHRKSPVELPEGVLDAELDTIVHRRQVAGSGSGTPTTANGAPTDKEKVKQSLIGLALSGGGVRSAAFNLGLLQSLYHHGLLRHVDYLSTVSGGGYIGSWFSSLILRFGPLCRNNERLAKELASWPGGRQPRRVTKLTRDGKYLDRLRTAWSHYSIGLIYNNLAILSFLYFVCLLIAYCWRAMDSQYVVYVLCGQMNFVVDMRFYLTEAVRPFLPGVLLFFFWLAAWMFAYRSRLPKGLLIPFLAWLVGVGLFGLMSAASLALAVIVILGSPWVAVPVGVVILGRVLYAIHKLYSDPDDTQPEKGNFWARTADVLFVLAVAAFLIGAVVLLSTQSVTTASLGTKRDSAKQTSDWTRIIVVPLIGLLVTALTPLLRPQRLLQSGLRPKSVWEQRVFSITTSALLLGVPLFLIWWLARHDYADTIKKNKDDRETRLVLADLVNPKGFKKHLEGEEKTAGSPGHYIQTVLKFPGTLEPIALTVQALAAQDRAPAKRLRAQAAWRDEHMLEQMDLVSVPVTELEKRNKQAVADVLNEYVVNERKFTEVFWHFGTNQPPGSNEGQEAETLLKFPEGSLYRTQLSQHPKAEAILRLMGRWELGVLTDDELPVLNRLLLEAYYPKYIRRQDQAIRPFVIDADQDARLFWLLVAFGFVLFTWLLVNLNDTSMHNFYHERLAATFIVGRQDPLLKDLDTTAQGAPYHLFSATLNQRPKDPSPSRVDPENLGQTKTEGFLLSKLYCGTARLGYQATEQYWNGTLTLADAMAISGAAVSPLQISNLFIVTLMVVLNLRTGQWVPRPQDEGPASFPDTWPVRLARWASAHLAGMTGPTLVGLVLDRVGSERKDRLLHFITDGGHHENLGLWPLLERRCRLVLVSDASEDGTSGFADLVRVVRRARFELGIRITGVRPAKDFGERDEEFTNLLELLRSGDEPTDEQVRRQAAEDPLPPGYRRSSRHFVLARIDYPDGEDSNPGYLIYLKPTLTGDEDADLQAYAAQNRDFPHHPTPDQLYDEDRFESYRQLGEHIGDRLCEEFQNRSLGPDLWECRSVLPIVLDEGLDHYLLERQNVALSRLVVEKTRRRRRILRIESARSAEARMR